MVISLDTIKGTLSNWALMLTTVLCLTVLAAAQYAVNIGWRTMLIHLMRRKK